MKNTSSYQLKQTCLITSAEVDFRQKVRLSSLTNLLIQAASDHAKILGWGFEDLIKHNLVWVLSGLCIQIDEYPRLDEEITIETWPKGINRLFYVRDYILYDFTGKKIGQATSNWLLIDVNTRRPKLHKLESDVFKQNLNKHAIEELTSNLKFTEFGEDITEYTVRFSDIDLNNHLTATRYIDWVFDTYHIDDLASRFPKELTINYVKEIVFGMNVSMCKNKVDKNTDQFQLCDKEGGKPFFKAELKF